MKQEEVEGKVNHEGKLSGNASTAAIRFFAVLKLERIIRPNLNCIFDNVFSRVKLDGLNLVAYIFVSLLKSSVSFTLNLKKLSIQRMIMFI